MNSDVTDPYTHLETELINRSGDSSQQEIRQLLSGEELGTRKPSDLLRNMRLRAETLMVPEIFMLELFLQRLPTSVQTILAAVTDQTLDKAAEISDRILGVTPVRMEIYAANKNNSNSAEKKLLLEIEKLNARIDKLEFSRSRSPFRRNRCNQRSRGNSQNRNSSVCWYHRRLRKNCKPEKCVSPCNFQGNENGEEKTRHVLCRRHDVPCSLKTDIKYLFWSTPALTCLKSPLIPIKKPTLPNKPFSLQILLQLMYTDRKHYP
ncbi:hypothetical protein AVEN_136586-1 [Araneus ventricosus]|uniref:Uncharacterized protein n=1 Tax=Araneus ventricosus TaxID=182803 RepID=A0A4Y2L920_ARAVE|nr:hypothetical protein AVEN_136586-1 [Araneus ventricosus]